MADSDRGTAVIVGVLFIVALVLYPIGGAFYASAIDSNSFLEQAYPDRVMVTLGVLIEFVAIVAIPLIGFFMFRVLRRWHETLALAYAGFRSLEAVLLIVIAGKVMTLIDLSESHLDVEQASSPLLQSIGESLLFEKDAIFTLYVLVFAVGALVFYGALYRSRLVPRWLSIWGLLSAAWMLVGTMLVMLGVFSGSSSSLVELVFVTPLPLNELTLGLWLIFKGFDLNATAPSTRPEVFV